MTTRTEETSKQYYTETGFQLKAPENYERYFVPVIGKPLAKDLIHNAALHEGQRVLDTGCGTGIVARLAAQQVGKTGKVTGLDINTGMLKVARSVTSSDMSIEWVEASAESMPFTDESFDAVLCQLSLQFMENKPAALKEIHRVLMPNGRLILNLPGPTGKIFIIFAGAMEHHIGSEAAEFVKHVFSLHDADELEQLMTDANFRAVDIQTEYKILKLPPPKDFLWQYIYSTPLGEVIAKVKKEARNALEQEIIEKWREFEQNGSMIYNQIILSASARK